MTRSSGWLPCSLTGAEPRASPCAAASSAPARSLRSPPTPFASFWTVTAAQTARSGSTRWSWRFTALGDSASWAQLSCLRQGGTKRVEAVMSWTVVFVIGKKPTWRKPSSSSIMPKTKLKVAKALRKLSTRVSFRNYLIRFDMLVEQNDPKHQQANQLCFMSTFTCSNLGLGSPGIENEKYLQSKKLYTQKKAV